jgi:DNA-binding Lrp family transcriptional regulator
MEAVANKVYLNPIQVEGDKVYYTPKSKFHVDFLWLSQWLKHLNCPRQAMLLLQVLYFSNKDSSVFANAIGETYQGMLVNFNALEDRLGFCRKVCLSAFKKLEEQGLIVRITLKNNRILYQSTHKANRLLDDLHDYSLAVNTDNKDVEAFSAHFQKADKISVLEGSYTQRDRQAFTFGDSSIYKVNNQRVNRKNNNQYNHSQELESMSRTENVDCDKTVIFDFPDLGIESVKCESKLFDYFTVSQAKVINTVAHANAKKIDMVAFNNALARKDIKREAKDFKQFVDWCYLVAVDTKGLMPVADGDVGELVIDSDRVHLGKVDDISDKVNHHNSQTDSKSKLDLDVAITELKAILKDKSIETITAKVTELNTQYAIDTENELVSAVLFDFGVIGEDTFLSGFGVDSDERNALLKTSLTTGSNTINERNDVVRCAADALKVYDKPNFDQIFKGMCYGDFDIPKLSDRPSVTSLDQNNREAKSNTKTKNALSRNPNLMLPTVADFKMPIIEKEVLYKDWASLAQQDLVKDTVTECQKVGIVAIIDYVKRKGVTITSDQEVYEWLYHTVANYEFYFSGANNFKHLANILIKRLVNQSFNRPSGFDNWRKMMGENSGGVSIKYDNKTNNNYLKSYVSEIDLIPSRTGYKISINNGEKSVKKYQKNFDIYRFSGGFVV